jgi:molybdopterin-guanine dinucleotide biosynthesis protein A
MCVIEAIFGYNPVGIHAVTNRARKGRNAMRISSCIGILLAGGLAHRMGGGDKVLRKIGGISLLAHAAATLRPQCADLVLSANGDQERFAGFYMPVVADNVPGFKGPLAGILAGLYWIAVHYRAVPLAISVPADTPFLPADLVVRLFDARARQNTLLACASSGNRTHPAIALWPVAIRDALRHALVTDETRKVETFAQNYSRAIVDWPIDPYDPFFNVNYPSDLAAAEAILPRCNNRSA